MTVKLNHKLSVIQPISLCFDFFHEISARNFYRQVYCINCRSHQNFPESTCHNQTIHHVSSIGNVITIETNIRNIWEWQISIFDESPIFLKVKILSHFHRLIFYRKIDFMLDTVTFERGVVDNFIVLLLLFSTFYDRIKTILLKELFCCCINI